MNCPNCNTPNNSQSLFCINCGGPLSGENQEHIRLGSYKPLLNILSARLILALIGLEIVNMILIEISFIKEFNIPNFDLTFPSIITILLSLVSGGLLIAFSFTLRGLWPQAYPKYQQAYHLFNTVIYVVILVMVYKFVKQFLVMFTIYSDLLMILQIVCIISVLVIIGRASVFVYQTLPIWIASIKLGFALPQVEVVEEKDEVDSED